MKAKDIWWWQAMNYDVPSTYPAVLDDGNTVAWFDSAESITKDGSDFVSVWGDKSVDGSSVLNGNDLLQATGTNQPLWSADGVLFDGVDNFMKCAAFTLIQPEKIYMVAKQLKWIVNDRLIDGNSANTGAMAQRGTTPNITLYSGSFISENSNLTLDTYGIIRALFSGVNSTLQVNETTATTGDVGSADMGGFIIGSTDGSIRFAKFEVKEVILRKVADGATDEAAIYAYLADKYTI